MYWTHGFKKSGQVWVDQPSFISEFFFDSSKTLSYTFLFVLLFFFDAFFFFYIFKFYISLQQNILLFWHQIFNLLQCVLNHFQFWPVNYDTWKLQDRQCSVSYRIWYFNFLCVKSISFPYPWHVVTISMLYLGIITYKSSPFFDPLNLHSYILFLFC